MKRSTARTLFSRSSDEWATPQWLVDTISRGFGRFDLDPCATLENAKAPRYFTAAVDGLSQPWGRCNWLNPPYSQVGRWLQKAANEAEKGAFVWALVPSRTDTRWWHQIVAPRALAYGFLKGRVRFERANGARGPAPFPSCLILFGPACFRERWPLVLP